MGPVALQDLQSYSRYMRLPWHLLKAVAHLRLTALRQWVAADHRRKTECEALHESCRPGPQVWMDP